MNQNNQSEVNSLVLYKSPICGYCARVTSFLKKHGIQLPERDTMLEADARSELLSGGGKAMVPCLRIEQSDGSFEWLYESLDILEYLKQLIRQP